jgi:hypothetical protein
LKRFGFPRLAEAKRRDDTRCAARQRLPARRNKTKHGDTAAKATRGRALA